MKIWRFLEGKERGDFERFNGNRKVEKLNISCNNKNISFCLIIFKKINNKKTILISLNKISFIKILF